MTSAASAVPAAAFAGVRTRIVAIFALHSIMFTTLDQRTPDLQVRLGLDDGALGLALIGASVGSFAMVFSASQVISRFGARASLLAAYVLNAVFAAAVAFAPSAPLLFAGMALLSASFTIGNVAMNVEADRVEAATGARIMARCHGVWSIGVFASSALGGFVRAAGVDARLHMLVMAPIVIVAALAVLLPMQAMPPRAAGGQGDKPAFAWPTLAVLAVALFGLGATLFQGSSRVWAAVLLRDDFGAPVSLQAASAPIVAATMAVARLFADPWIESLGPKRMGALSTVTSLAGVAVIVLAQNPSVALIGFALGGLGISVGYPMMISAAARLTDRPSAVNVAATSLIVQSVMLFAPALIGLVAQHYGVRAAYIGFIPIFMVGFAMARRL